MQQQIICYLFPFKAYFYRPGFYFYFIFHYASGQNREKIGNAQTRGKGF